ncbi:MAG: hypothetical protein CVV27_03275, partial [Candidatus Melainabacteria bacterium HGW-Melainabacteria-1]
MPNLNVNGRTVDPGSIRHISVPEGETPQSYVKKNEALIRKNFRDEMYYEQEGKLYVTEDKFVVESMGGNLKDHKLRAGAVPAIPILLDNEPDAHKVTELVIEGAGKHQDWLKKELKVEQGDRVNLHDLQKQADKLFASQKFLEVDFSPTATDKGIKLTLSVKPVPEQISFVGVEASRSKAFETHFPKPLTAENIHKGMAALETALEQDPQHLLRGLSYQINNGELQIMASQVQVPTKLNLRGANAEDSAKVQSFFSQPLNHGAIEKGIGQLKDFYAKQGLVVPRLEFEVQGDQLHLDFGTSPMPTRTEFKGMSVYKPEDIQKLFPMPLTMENIQKGMLALKQKYADDGYLLMPQPADGPNSAPETVSADLQRGVLTINVAEARLSDIVVTGNDKTKAEVIRRELRAEADKPVNVKTLEQDLARVQGTGLFAHVNHTVEPDPEN